MRRVHLVMKRYPKGPSCLSFSRTGTGHVHDEGLEMTSALVPSTIDIATPIVVVEGS